MEDPDRTYCKLCLVTDVKMYSLNTPSILEAYSQLLQVVICENYQTYICYECASLLRKCEEFRLKCVTSLNLLTALNMDHSKITKKLIQTIDRNYYNLVSKDKNINEVDSDLEIKHSEPEVTLKMDIEFDDPNNDTLDDIILNDDNVKKVIDSGIKSELNWPEDTPNMDAGDAKPGTLDDILNDKTSDETSNYCIVQTNRSLENDHNYITKIEKTFTYLKRKPDWQNYVTEICLTPEDVKKAMLLRKESTNYQLNRYKCNFCYKGFISLTTYDNHMKKHSPKLGVFECDHCHQRFSKKIRLRRHIEQCHRWKYECKICQYVCYSMSQRGSHINLHKGKVFECQECGKRFNLSNTLSSHKRHKHPTEVVCALCGSLFGSLLGLNAHQKITHKQDSTELLGPKCEECDVQFATEIAWKRHLVLSSKHTVSNGCVLCGETFNTEEGLRIHKKTHPTSHPSYAYRNYCKICNKMFETLSQYKKHMKLAHPRSDVPKKIKKHFPPSSKLSTPAVCEVCGKVAKNVYILRDHQLTHINKRPFECGECGKRFTQRASLRTHQNVHTRKYVYECDVCQKQYAHKLGLAKHIKFHFGFRPFECSYCHKRFMYKYERRMHTEYVHLSKPWPQRDRSKRSAKIQPVSQ